MRGGQHTGGQAVEIKYIILKINISNIYIKSKIGTIYRPHWQLRSRRSLQHAAVPLHTLILANYIRTHCRTKDLK